MKRPASLAGLRAARPFKPKGPTMLHDNSTPRQLACDACKDSYRRATTKAQQTAFDNMIRETAQTRYAKIQAFRWMWVAWQDVVDCATGGPCASKRRAP